MADDSPASGVPAEVASAASAWLARRDRGLTAAEQDAYLEWLRADPRHARAVAHLEKTWGALDALAEWRPAHSTAPNPDLLARRKPRRLAPVVRFALLAGTLAAAAAVALVMFRPELEFPAPRVSRSVRVIPPPEKITLSDGSVVELNHGGKIETDFTPGMRLVRLVHGEAHFTVTKNTSRPFFVAARGVSVRAVGTAFDVRHTPGAVEVLVTEGKVQVDRVPPSAAGPALAETPAPLAPSVTTPAPTPLVAGERAVVDTNTPAARPVVAVATENEIAQTLVWQGVRLEFADLPLREVVAEFNLRNRRQLVIGDAATGGILVGGSFRADNLDAFLRLLKASFGVIVERGPDDSLVLLYRGK